jgi:hypothetical protein
MQNTSHVNDPTLTALLKAQRRTKDLAARKQLIFDIQRYEAEQQYYVYLACLMVTGSHQPYIKNYAANSLITRRATTLLSRTHTAWREGSRLWRSMAQCPRATACLFRSPMTAECTRCALSLAQKPLVRPGNMKKLCVTTLAGRLGP